jgi:hypothetical protein
MKMIQECQMNIGLKLELDPEQSEELRKLAEWVQCVQRVLAPGTLPELPREGIGQGYATSEAVSNRANPPLLQITSISLSPIGPPKDESILKILADGFGDIKREWDGERSVRL